MSLSDSTPQSNTAGHGLKDRFARAEAKPETLPVQPDGIPTELKLLHQWVAWRWERRDEKWTKPPVNPHTGHNADKTKPADWGTFDQVYQLVLDGRADGIGFVFTAEDPYVGIDLDDCRDPETGELLPWADRIVKAFATCADVSPSSTGVKLFGRGRLPGKGKRRGNIEVYDRAWYFTITGVPVEGFHEIRDCQAQLDKLVAWMTKTKKSKPHEDNGRAHGDDEKLLVVARRCPKFVALFDRGDISGYDSDDSRADLALANLLAFYCGNDASSIERLFYRSALGQRTKWKDRADYRGSTIDKALEGRTEFYQWTAPSTDGQADGKKTAYQIIREFWTSTYAPAFRRGSSIYSSTLGREIKQADALTGAPIALIDLLAGAKGAPRNDEGVNRNSLPAFFKKWAPSAWVDMISALPDEEDAAEIVEPAADEVRAIVSRALLTIVTIGGTYKAGQMERTEVERRTLLDWCIKWAKPGGWKPIRSHQLWVKREREPGDDDLGRLAIALTTELFGQVGIVIGARKRFARLLKLYDVAVDVRRSKGGRMLRLRDEYLGELLQQPDDEGGDN